jgi:hypothetical protein
MLYNRTYLDKCTTIVRGSKLNTGFNPVSELVYGRNNSRFLLHFDHNKIKKMVEDKTFADITKLKHTLKITNAGSLDFSQLHKVYNSQIDGANKKRATSFDLIYFLIPEDWDNGKGFDYTKDCFTADFYDPRTFEFDKYISEDGANWFKPMNGKTWKKEPDFMKTTDELLKFFIKSDKNEVSVYGDTVVFTYCCCLNGTFANKNLVFKSLSNSLDFPIEVGTPIYFSRSGQICNTDADILKYAEYAKVAVKFPNTTNARLPRYIFRCEYEIGGKLYHSNPYTITTTDGKSKKPVITDDGIYSTDTLQEELELFNIGEDSIVIGRQHFDIGCENISIDITRVFNAFITGELENHGIGIAFSPTFEYETSNIENYVGLLTNRTNSFFEPYVETIYEDSIKDDRANFVLGKPNRLYLYSNIGGDLVNLDKIPSCSVNETEYVVKQGGKGTYYIDITIPQNTFSAPTMLYDVWDGIVYHGETLSPVEMEFTTKPSNMFFQLGSELPERGSFTPTVYGINDSEQIKRGDVRKVCFIFRKDYTRNTGVVVDDVQVRLYVMDGTAQVDVTPYIVADRALNDTYVMIDTSMLIPNTYYMDVRVKYGMEMIGHHNVLHFTIVNEENNRYA